MAEILPPKLDVVAFSVTVENQAEIRQWIDQLGKARDALEAQFKALIELTENTPMIQMTLHREAS